MDNSQIHKEGYRARLTKGQLKPKAILEYSSDKISIKIKPKCSK